MASYKFLKSATVALLVALNVNLAFGYCSTTWCSSFYSSRDYCCSGDRCCTYSEYVAETATNYFTLGIGAIVGIVIGAIVLIIGSIVACVFCCCRPNRTTGRVVTTTQTVQQPVMMQNQYANQAAYPPGAQPYPAGAQSYPIGSAQPYPGQPPVYDQQAGVAPPMYPSKDGGVGGAMPPQY